MADTFEVITQDDEVGHINSVQVKRIAEDGQKGILTPGYLTALLGTLGRELDTLQLVEGENAEEFETRRAVLEETINEIAVLRKAVLSEAQKVKLKEPEKPEEREET